MTDVVQMLANANPVNEDDLSPSFATVWRGLDGGASRPRRHVPVRRPLMLGSATSALAAATLAIVLVSSGGAPTEAEAFPILATRGTDISGNPRLRQAALTWFPPDGLLRALRHAHSFPTPAPYGLNGTGYLLHFDGKRAGGWLCLLLTAGHYKGDLQLLGPYACGRVSSVKQTGLVVTSPNVPAWGYDSPVFAVLVPTGGTVALTQYRGKTTPVPVHNGIAAGAVHVPPATLTITIAGATQTIRFPVSVASGSFTGTKTAPATSGRSATNTPGRTPGPTTSDTNATTPIS